MDLADKLNAADPMPRPSIEEGQIAYLYTYDKADKWSETEVPLTDEQYAELGLDKDDLGCLDDHPEGADRGGYVPTLNDGTYYDENCGEWCS